MIFFFHEKDYSLSTKKKKLFKIYSTKEFFKEKERAPLNQK